MKFKAKLSPKQMFTYRGSRLKAQDGIFITNEDKIIELLKNNPYWECLEEKVNENTKQELLKPKKKAIQKESKEA